MKGVAPAVAGVRPRGEHVALRIGQRAGAARVLGVVCGLFLLGVATRAPFVGEFLASWDAVQYALGLVDFDVMRHQPHPPGSILYVALGRVLLGVAGSAQGALAAISVVSGGVGAALCWVAGRELFGSRVAAAGTALYVTSPLTWYYGAVALPYALEGAVALAAVALLWRAAEERRVGVAVGAGVLLAVAGGIRQTTMLLLLPLWVFATWRAAGLPAPAVLWRERHAWRGWVRRGRGLLWGVLLMGALCLLWVVPLLVLTGGPGEYVAASRRLSSLLSSLNSLLIVGLPAVAANVAYLADVTAMGLTVALAPFAVFLLPGVAWPWRPDRPQRWFLLLWAVPALAVFVLLHVGQAGYLLIVWPLACYAAGTAALAAGDVLGARVGWTRGAVLLVVLLALTNATVYLAAPLLGRVPVGLSRRTIADHDAAWRGIREEVARGPAGAVAVLTGTQTAESFRLATYYLPEARVFAVGLDRDGELGIAFSGFGGEHTYADFMAGVPGARSVSLTAGTRRLLILDESVSRLFPPHALEEVPVSATRRVWRSPVLESGGGVPRLEIRYPLDVP